MKELNDKEKRYIMGCAYIIFFQLILYILVLSLFGSAREYFHLYVVIGGNALILFIMRCYIDDNIH